MNDRIDQGPAAFLDRLERAAKRTETPCGDGMMVWRSWGDGPVLVLFHGGAGSWRHWAHNIDVLSQAYRLLVPDLPGLGERLEGKGISLVRKEGAGAVYYVDHEHKSVFEGGALGKEYQAEALAQRCIPTPSLKERMQEKVTETHHHRIRHGL